MKKLLYTIVAITIGLPTLSQDIHYSQFWDSGALFNPGLTGLGQDKVRAGLQYRDQWSAIDRTYKTGLFHVDAPLLGGKNRTANIGLGGYVFFDKAGAGTLGQTEVALQVSGIVKIANNQWISAGLRGAYIQYKSNSSTLQWGTQFDGSSYNATITSGEPDWNQQTGTPDFSAGIAYYYSNSADNKVTSSGKTWFTAGIAYHHVASPSVGFSDPTNKLESRIVASMNGRIDLGTTKYGILPAIFFSTQHKATEISVGALFRYGLGTDSKYTGLLSESEIAAGLMYRVGDAIVPVIRFQTSHLGIGVSYDFTTSKLGAAVKGNGGWEISLRILNLGGLLGGTSGKSMI